MNKQSGLNSLNEFRRAIRSIDNQIILQKLKKYQFEDNFNDTVDMSIQALESCKVVCAQIVDKEICFKRPSNPFKAKLLSKIQN